MPSQQEALITDLVSGSVVSGLFLPFVPGLLYDAGLRSPFQFMGMYLAQKLILSVARGNADSAARVAVIGLVASIAVVVDVVFSTKPSEIAFVLLGIFTWASDSFFPYKKQSSENVIMTIGNQKFDLVPTLLTFGTPVLASVVYLIGGKMLIGVSTVGIMLFNAQRVVNLAEVSKLQKMVKELDKDKAFAIICLLVRKIFVEGLTATVFPGYYTLNFGLTTAYSGFVYAAQMAAFRLRVILFDIVPDLEKMLGPQSVIFAGISGALAVLDMVFGKNLAIHLGLIFPLIALLKLANQKQMKEFDNNKDWNQWLDIPSEILGCLIPGILYSIFPLARGIALNGLGCAFAFALFIPGVRSQVENILGEILKSSKGGPPPLPPKPNTGKKED
jgi:hypothetical protein